jgi:hypothetical protein
MTDTVINCVDWDKIKAEFKLGIRDVKHSTETVSFVIKVEIDTEGMYGLWEDFCKDMLKQGASADEIVPWPVYAAALSDPSMVAAFADAMDVVDLGEYGMYVLGSVA